MLLCKPTDMLTTLCSQSGSVEAQKPLGQSELVVTNAAEKCCDTSSKIFVPYESECVHGSCSHTANMKLWRLEMDVVNRVLLRPPVRTSDTEKGFRSVLQ